MTYFKAAIRGTLFTLLLLLAYQPAANAQQAAPATKPPDAAYYGFRNAATAPPLGWPGPVFQLSHNYPHQPPLPSSTKCPEKECPWLYVKVNFTPNFPKDPKDIKSPNWHEGNWDLYLNTILKYVMEGQTSDLNNETGWQVNVNKKTRWFNVPWMAYDPTAGREFVHGTTNERTASVEDLMGATHQPHGHTLFAGETESCKNKYPYGFESWSVGYYNEYGGYAMGRAIPATGVPQMSTYLGVPIPAGLPFPEGTVVVKILTSSIPVECAPFLHGSPAWQIDRHSFSPTSGYSCDRTVQVSHVVQVDVAVTDSRSPIGWVYGTFAYDGDVPGNTFWDHLVPLGLQWGSDPWTFPAVPKSASLPLQQSVINKDIGTFQHLGCMDRLAGPVDNPSSSCTSCHASAYAMAKGAVTDISTNAPPSFGFAGMCQVFSQQNSDYFQNQIAPQGFPGGLYPGTVTMDTSLQLEVAFTQYGNFNTNHAPNQCTNPNQQGPPKPHVSAFAKEDK